MCVSSFNWHDEHIQQLSACKSMPCAWSCVKGFSQGTAGRESYKNVFHV